MPTALRRWSRSIIAAIAVLMLVPAAVVAGPSVAYAQTAPPLQTHV